MNEYNEVEAHLHPFLTSALDTRFTPWKRTPVPVLQKICWAAQPVWTFRREQTLVYAGNRTM